MILIADSGSSKTDWRLIDALGQITQFKGIGFNPNYQSLEDMSQKLQVDFLLKIKNEVQSIFYYGAGCASDQNKNQVRSALSTVFEHADIQVNHDLMAAAKATCGNQPGIACILGTGSNSCDYDGENIIDKRPAPGYILGDEGGGAYIGKKFLQDFIHEDMPEYLRKSAAETLNLNITDIIDNVYKKPFPGRYMASFCPYISENCREPYYYGIIYDSFQDFFKKHVIKFKDYQNKPVSFVGSVAYHNSNILRKAASDIGIHVHLILEGPISGLTLYHKNRL
jgi:N-acetylglucosamine kinase-like BadF-type ATPase